MRIGEQAYLKYQFAITSFDLDRGVLSLTVYLGDTAYELIKVPIWLSNLGFTHPELDFCVPGDNWPLDHPDYFEIVSTDRGLWVSYEGERYKCILDRDFHLTGEYRLVGDHADDIIVVKSQLRTDMQRRLILEDMVNQRFDGNLIQGTIIYLFINSSKGIMWPNHFLGVAYSKRAYAVLQDPITKVQFSLPAHLLEVKNKT